MIPRAINVHMHQHATPDLDDIDMILRGFMPYSG